MLTGEWNGEDDDLLLAQEQPLNSNEDSSPTQQSNFLIPFLPPLNRELIYGGAATYSKIVNCHEHM